MLIKLYSFPRSSNAKISRILHRPLLAHFGYERNSCWCRFSLFFVGFFLSFFSVCIHDTYLITAVHTLLRLAILFRWIDFLSCSSILEWRRRERRWKKETKNKSYLVGLNFFFFYFAGVLWGMELVSFVQLTDHMPGRMSIICLFLT